jgi:hypothetical protein
LQVAAQRLPESPPQTWYIRSIAVGVSRIAEFRLGVKERAS